MSMTSVKGKLSKLIFAGSRVQSVVQTLPEVVVTASRIYDKAGKYSTTNLSYPLNVEGDPQQGHYISFYARSTNPARLKAFKAAQGRIASTMKKVHAEVGGSPGDIATRQAKHISSHGISGASSFAEDRATVSGNDNLRLANSIRLMRRATTRTKTAISLYMPPSVQVSYESKYGDQEIGILAGEGYDAIKAFMSPGGMDKTEAMAALGGIELGAKQAILKTLDVVAPGASALFAIDRGKIITPKMELMFEGIGRRNFSFTFVFIPKSEQEAQVVKDIIYKFKHHMAADYADGNTREMKFPDMFDIEYMHIGKQNPNLNKIATCALTKMDVEYGGDRYVAYEGGVPQTTKLSLSFTEFDIITKKHIEAGF